MYTFKHWLADKAEYKCSFRNKGVAGFDSKLPVVAAPAATSDGVDVPVELVFEPSSVGEFRDVLVLSSATAGEYECPVTGRCVPPKPQGPVDLSKVSWVSRFAGLLVHPHRA